MDQANLPKSGPPHTTGGPLHETVLHASTVAAFGKAVVILGASGRGKSALALELMAYGAELVADDRTILRKSEDMVIASCPDALAKMVEARGMGILNATAHGPTPVALFVDLDQVEAKRLPDLHAYRIFDQSFPLLFSIEAPHFAPAILQYLKAGRKD